MQKSCNLRTIPFLITSDILLFTVRQAQVCCFVERETNSQPSLGLVYSAQGGYPHSPCARVLNGLADWLSRWQIDQWEWRLPGQIVRRLFRFWSQPQVVLFATCHNFKVPTSCSLSISWSDFTLACALLPVVLLLTVLRKVRIDRAQVLLIAPRWPLRAWYSILLDLMADVPQVLPARPDLLSQFQILHRRDSA